ncbi:unnamed protein product [Brassica oleracea]|uniref:(rape) hypothetical protein n=1 Tax=Brassica napus TaxID=3708 RepID=A0A816KME4_BRANA|nr:unnamed protein product [Brassica napus]
MYPHDLLTKIVMKWDHFQVGKGPININRKYGNFTSTFIIYFPNLSFIWYLFIIEGRRFPPFFPTFISAMPASSFILARSSLGV